MRKLSDTSSLATRELGSFKEIKNLTAKEERKRILANTMEPEVSTDYYEFKLCKSKSVRINKSLLTFRITQFIWYGGGVLPSTFLGIFLQQRGLTILELSSVFSVVFLFQFVSSAIAGTVADKIGNAKPVLMFVMFSAVLTTFLMLLTPNINSGSCNSQEIYLNGSDLSEYRNNFSSCYASCLFSHRKHGSHEEAYNGSSLIRNAYLVDKEIPFETGGGNESACGFYDILLKNTSLGSLNDSCCNACADSLKTDCGSERNVKIIVAYAILIFVFYSVYPTVYRFLNFTAVSLADKTDTHLGKEFAIAKTADVLSLIVIAFVLNTDKSSGSGINYDPIIWIAVGITFCASLTSFAITVPILPPGKNLLKSAFVLIRDIDTLVFIFLVFVAGNGYAFYFTFHLVFFQTVNAPSIVVALHSVVIYVYGLIILLTYKWWLNKLGKHKIFVLGLFFNGVNFAAYSFAHNPWWFLIIDISVAFAFDLYWVAVVEHCWNTAPVGFAATLTALTGTVQYGIGRSSGVFFGGMLMSYLGLRKAYRIIAAVFFGAAVLYSIFRYKRSKAVVPPKNGIEIADASKNTDSSRCVMGGIT